MPAARGRLTSSVTPSAVPRRIIGTSRVHSLRTAFFGLSRPTPSAQARSASANSASANLSGTKWVASGMVTSAAPKPVIPKISAPRKAIADSSAVSNPTDHELPRRALVHVPQLRHVARERQLIARFELLGAAAQLGPFDGGRHALEGEHQDVGIVERRHDEHRAGE